MIVFRFIGGYMNISIELLMTEQSMWRKNE